MKTGLLLQIDVFARQMTPFLLTVMFMFFSMLPLHIPGLAMIMPTLGLMSVYHWAVYRTNLMPVYAVFVLGLLQDFLSSSDIGLYALVYLVVYGIAISQHRFLIGKSFFIVWLGFILISAVSTSMIWLLSALLNQTVTNPEFAIYQYLLSVAVYPLLARLFLNWQTRFLQQV